MDQLLHSSFAGPIEHVAAAEVLTELGHIAQPSGSGQPAPPSTGTVTTHDGASADSESAASDSESALTLRPRNHERDPVPDMEPDALQPTDYSDRLLRFTTGKRRRADSNAQKG